MKFFRNSSRIVSQSLRQIDLLFFSYFLITTALIVLSFDKTTNAVNLLITRAQILFAVFGILYWNAFKINTVVIFFRNTYPIIFSGYFYSETVFYNKLIFDNLDPIFIKLDAFFTASQPSLLFSSYFSNSLFSELMYFGYFSFYLLILGIVLYTFFKKRTVFHETIFILSASLYIFYLIFGLFPSAGPQFYFSFPENNLPDAYFFDKVMHFIQKNGEQPTGAFPSSHVGISIIILILLKKKVSRLIYRIAFPFVIILILSTVYIKAHYVVDVIAGAIFAPIIYYISSLLYKPTS